MPPSTVVAKQRKRQTRRQIIMVSVPLCIVLSALSLSACINGSGRAASPAATSTSTAAPFWQTATARVEAVRDPTKATLHPLESSTPIPNPSVGSAAAVGIHQLTAGIASGSQLLDRTFTSAALGREMHYFIYLPAGYAESGKRYPVMYMLHGYGGSNTEWIAYGFPETADKMMNAGEIPPMIIVLPQGDQAYWVNHADNGERWGDYTAQDVVQQIDATYRTIADPKHRAIGGLSMGAHGAMQLALNYPGTFGVVGMHSPTLRDYATALPYFGDEAFFDAHDPVHLVQAHPDAARQLKILLDVGEQDQEWHDPTVAFHDLLTQLNIPHEFHTWPGDHGGDYWGAHCADYLRFYGVALSG